MESPYGTTEVMPFHSVTIAFSGLSIRYSLMGAMVFVYW